MACHAAAGLCRDAQLVSSERAARCAEGLLRSAVALATAPASACTTTPRSRSASRARAGRGGVHADGGGGRDAQLPGRSAAAAPAGTQGTVPQKKRRKKRQKKAEAAGQDKEFLVGASSCLAAAAAAPSSAASPSLGSRRELVKKDSRERSRRRLAAPAGAAPAEASDEVMPASLRPGVTARLVGLVKRPGLNVAVVTWVPFGEQRGAEWPLRRGAARRLNSEGLC